MRAGAITFLVVAGLGVADGGFFPESWGPSVVLISWATALVLLLAPRVSVPARGELMLALGCAVAAWTLLGAVWSDSVTATMLEAERALVVVAALLALLLTRDRVWTPRGVVAAATLVGGWNLCARQFGGESTAPVGYPNALAALAALAIPLALRERRTWPALVVLAPALAAQGSRGALLALVLGFIAAALRRPVVVVPLIVIAIATAWGTAGLRHSYYRVAVDQARAAPVAGTGAGTWEQWWLSRRPTPNSALDAHSVYLETLGEQGVVGLALLGAFLAVPLSIRPRDRLLVGAYATFLIHAAVDWDREIVALWVAGVAVGVTLLPDARAEVARRGRVALGCAVLALGSLGVLSGVAQISLAHASDAARAHQLGRAETLANRALRIEPWSSRPLEVRGEAQLAAGRRRAAATSFRRALAKDPLRWRLWHDLEQATGSRRAGREAKRLNPLGG